MHSLPTHYRFLIIYFSLLMSSQFNDSMNESIPIPGSNITFLKSDASEIHIILQLRNQPLPSL